MKKFLTIALVAFLVFFVAYHPGSAVAIAKTIGGWIVTVANGFATFFSNLV